MEKDIVLKKQLTEEELKKISGGDMDQKTLYCLNQLIRVASSKYDAWYDPGKTYSQQEKNAAAKRFFQEACENLDQQEQALIDQFIADNPLLWQQVIESICKIA